MKLVIQVCGVLLLGGLLGTLIRTDGESGLVVGLTAVAVSVTGLAFWSNVWSTGHTFVEQAKGYPSSIHEANVAPGSLFPADVGLLTEAEAVIPPNARVYLMCLHNSVGCSGEWVSYQLSPRLFVSNINEARYVLVYGASPKTVPAVAHLRRVLDYSNGGVALRAPNKKRFWDAVVVDGVHGETFGQ